jgi:hypothetical protein
MNSLYAFLSNANKIIHVIPSPKHTKFAAETGLHVNKKQHAIKLSTHVKRPMKSNLLSSACSIAVDKNRE